MPQTCGIVCTGMYGNRGQRIKGRVDNPGREIYSYCTQPEALNRFCGHLPDGHDFKYCREKSEKTKKVLCDMKKIIRTLDYAYVLLLPGKIHLLIECWVFFCLRKYISFSFIIGILVISGIRGQHITTQADHIDSISTR